MKTYIASLVMSFTAVAQSQTFTSAADCEQEYRRLTTEATTYDNQWSDCAAGTSHGALYSCSNMSSQQRILTFSTLAKKRDSFSAQAKNLWPICQQMVSNERDQQRTAALARQESQQQLQQQQREQQRRQIISIQQYESDRRAEALSAANTERRAQTLDRQAEVDRQMIAKQRSDNAKAAAVGSLAAALVNMLSSSRTQEDSDSDSDSDSDKYSNIQDQVEKRHEKVQKEQSEFVNRIQNAAWAKIREQNLATLQDLNDVTKAVSGFRGDVLQKNPWDSSSGRSAQWVSTTPPNPWQEAQAASKRLKPVIEGAAKTIDSACDDNPWACDNVEAKRPNKKRGDAK